MRLCSVSTRKYDVDIKKLLDRRLREGGSALRAEAAGKGCASVAIGSDEDMDDFCDALSAMLLMDIAHFELANIINELPFAIEGKRAVLSESVKSTRRGGGSKLLSMELRDYYGENDELLAEGFVRFRMQREKRLWEQCVENAAEELLLRAEYLELMSVLSALVRVQRPRLREISVILHPDGSCTLADDTDARVDYAMTNDDGVISLLVSLAPERITVYDLSCGKAALLTDALTRVFEDRVRFFK